MGRRGCGEEDGKVPSTSERMRALDALRGCEGRGAMRVCTKDASRNAEGRGPDPPLFSALRLCGSPRPLPKWSIARECCHGDGLSGGASQHRPVIHICAAPLPLSSLFLSVSGKQLLSDATLKLALAGRRGPGDIRPRRILSLSPLRGGRSSGRGEGPGRPGSQPEPLPLLLREVSLEGKEFVCRLPLAPSTSGGVSRWGGQVGLALLSGRTFPPGPWLPCLPPHPVLLLPFLARRCSSWMTEQAGSRMARSRLTGEAGRREQWF